MKYVQAGEACTYFQISYMTIKRWKDSNIIKTKQFSQKKILYDLDSVIGYNHINEQDNRQNVIYARVSTTKQKQDLENQINLIKQFMLSNGIKPDNVYKEIASGLNEDRLQLNLLIKDITENKIKNIYITYKDRLTRFGFGYFKSFFQNHNCNIIVLDEIDSPNKNKEEELVNDLISIIHHYSTKLYSSRKKQINEIKKLISQDFKDDK